MTIHNDNAKQGQSSSATSGETSIWLLYAILGLAIFQSALVLLGNTQDQAVWLLVLLAATIGQGLLLPSRFAWFGGLAAVVLWVMARQTLGIWVQSQLVQSMLEVAALVAGLVLVAQFRRRWEQMQTHLDELGSLRDVLIAGEAGSGLLPWEVAELRLKEEVDRAHQFGRPVGLLLVSIEGLDEPRDPEFEAEEVERALVRQLVSNSLVHDVPFRITSGQLGVILPERSWDSLYRDAESTVQALRQATFLGQDGHARRVPEHVRLDFGLGTYQGERAGDIDLMRAARDSLSVSRDLADIGETRVTAYAMPATPIVASGPESARQVD